MSYFVRTAGCSARRLAAAGMLCLTTALTPVASTAQDLIEFDDYREFSGVLPDGTPWLIWVPNDWNGVLLRDLDFVNFINLPDFAPRYEDMLRRGYAFAGNARHPMRTLQYDPRREIMNLEQVHDIFLAEVGEPERVLAYGCSGGGLDSLSTAESFGDRIDAAAVLAAHTPVWIAGSYLDGFFSMRALLGDLYEERGLGPASDLTVAHFPNAGDRGRTMADIAASWTALVQAASETPEGRARLALAFAIAQWSPWTSTGVGPALPDLSDIPAMTEALVQAALFHAARPGGTGRLLFENAAYGQQLDGNDGVDYAAYYENAAPAMRNLVAALYDAAGLDLAADIATINAADRISTSQYARDWWSEAGRTATGHPQVPVMRIHNLGDWAIPYSLMQGYRDVIEENGETDMYRQALVEGTGHCETLASEGAVVVEVLMRRLDTGEWPDTSPEALNALAAEIDTPEAGTFIPYGDWEVGHFNRTWVPGQ